MEKAVIDVNEKTKTQLTPQIGVSLNVVHCSENVCVTLANFQ